VLCNDPPERAVLGSSSGVQEVHVELLHIDVGSLKTRFLGLHFCCREYRSVFNHFDVIGPNSY